MIIGCDPDNNFCGAGWTMCSYPNRVKMVGRSIYQPRFIGQNACFYVAFTLAFHADVGTCQIGRTNVSNLTVENQDLEVNSRQSLRFKPLHKAEYLSKSARKSGPGSLACINRTSTPRRNRISKAARKGLLPAPTFTYKSLTSAVPIQSECLMRATRLNTSIIMSGTSYVAYHLLLIVSLETAYPQKQYSE